ncbi:tRNA-specific 2-thiouridylase mnmA [Zostera marina]|uniref:tRNA-5-taurinomethyluridine 2-sulfurtransferase n=1 Tax=Zostera marina TaxID=29655 RepID=A0A0K9NWF4_ZOSMR|nr:tRNA-specific 2-thiouridylase mnmA [Zostera marina]
MRRAIVMASTAVYPIFASLQNPPNFLWKNPLLPFFHRNPQSRMLRPWFSSTCNLSSQVIAAVSASVVSKNSIEYNELKPYLSCSVVSGTEKRLKVAVLLSGGVDSSVALRLLHAAGHSCTAFYLKIWFQEDFENFWSGCPWDEDLKYAQAVCNEVDVPLEVVHLSEEYWTKVVSYIISEYRCGRTPNPDILCNTRIKFGAFLDAIKHLEFDYVASGHYAHIIHSSQDKKEDVCILKLSKDMVKDQTYFLSHLSQNQLTRLLFPLGCLTKDEVRKLAAKMNLPNKDRKDSQGICFLGKVNFSEFISKHIGEKEGILLEAETGDYLGIHRGFWFYTIGQRQGLRLPGGPWYVVEKDVCNNVIFVSRKYFSCDKRRRTFRVGSLKWIRMSPGKSVHLLCKVRHGPGFYKCRVSTGVSEDGDEKFLVVNLFEDDQGLASGQFTAFYEDDICIGSGVILDSWDDLGFPVCTKAREIANMKDKSKLGKPVRIINLESNT